MEPGTTPPPPRWRNPPTKLRRRASTGLCHCTTTLSDRPPTPSHVVILLLVSASLLSLVSGQRTNSSPRPQQRFAIEPTDRSAILGDTIVLACRVIDKAGTLQWTRDGFGLGSDRDLSGFPRYSMVGSDDEGDFSLQIGSVSLEDDATFQCQVGAVDGVKGIRSRSAPLTVFVPPEPPKIVQGEFLKTTAGMTVELTCESHAGKPPAELTWLDGSGNVVTNGVEYKTEPLSDGKRANAALTWTFSPSREHDGKTFTCRSENKALKQPMLATIRMEVKYPPDITLTVESDKISEFDDVRFHCQATANPSDIVYKWYRNDEIIAGDHTTELVLPRVTRSFNGDTITCEARNDTFPEARIHPDRPAFKSAAETVAAEEGAEVALRCEVDSNPKPDIVWRHEGSERVLARQPTLVIPAMRPSDAGRYSCRATVPGFPEITQDVHVYVKGPPKVSSPTTQYGVEGEQVRVECIITSVPPPTRVAWSRNLQLVDIDNNQGYEIVKEPLSNGLRNLLIIHNAAEEDFGQYNCSVWNQFGYDTRLITVRKQKNLPMVIILAGVIGGIVLVVTVTISIILCLRKKNIVKDDDFNSEKKGKQSDSASSGDSDIKVEIRTASSLSNNEHDRNWEDNSESARTHDAADIYKYANSAADYGDSSFPVKSEAQNNNGYIPYVDYSRDYNPPPVAASLQLNASRDSGLYGSSPQSLNDLGQGIDPRFRAGYANPYLRTSQSNLPPPQGVYVSPRAMPSVAANSAGVPGASSATLPQNRFT
ncbi:hypothetical protein HPB49_008162 [Dermacentor silvarum]|uniref:Uncharacterized protein n=1 Tax=Dermacentor silvarum TaxID=543639 RepID=A0ACB8CJV6_DERSI|nr:hypothetical protein HPB49_008162 [Dermacentor silvarum]